MNVIEHVNHPKHYNAHPSGIECIEVTRHLPSNLANAFKYVFRAGHKGNKKQDLEKALWYIEDQILLEKKYPYVKQGLFNIPAKTALLIKAVELKDSTDAKSFYTYIYYYIFSCSSEELHKAKDLLESLIKSCN